LEHAPRDPDHTTVFADLDPELHGLLLGVPSGIFGEGEKHPGPPIRCCSLNVREIERNRKAPGGFDLQREAAAIRERVGYMSQRLSLYPELSVFENLRFRAAVYGLRNPRAVAESAICEFGLVRWARSPAGFLSGGWARRLQLAASLLHSPGLVLLDEPTAGLDTAARQEVWRRVEDLAAAGAGVIVCTHDLGEAERCSHTALFANGKVITAGAPAEITARAPAAAFFVCGTDVAPAC
jgi:ABC-2 type transport system ATP-binding protein